MLVLNCFTFQVRDYIHVVDLADGHIAALRKLFNSEIGQNSDIVSLVMIGFM